MSSIIPELPDLTKFSRAFLPVNQVIDEKIDKVLIKPSVFKHSALFSHPEKFHVGSIVKNSRLRTKPGDFTQHAYILIVK
ncbi:MAG: hypothetical protein ACTSVI_02915 [Promethearchaeota archaeon]